MSSPTLDEVLESLRTVNINLHPDTTTTTNFVEHLNTACTAIAGRKARASGGTYMATSTAGVGGADGRAGEAAQGGGHCPA